MSEGNVARVYVKGLWRYPVKSLGGEALSERGADARTASSATGSCTCGGDRGPLTGRSRHQLLTIPASTGRTARRSSRAIRGTRPRPRELVRRARAGTTRACGLSAGPSASTSSTSRSPTDGAVEELGDRRAPAAAQHPHRRDLPADAERSLARAARSRSAMRSSASTRCGTAASSRPSTPTPASRTSSVLRRIRERYANQVSLDCWVIRPGVIRARRPRSS